MKPTMENKTSLLYALAITVVVSILVIFYFTNEKERSTAILVEHSQEVLRKSDSILMDVLNIETGFRGYLLTGDEIFLEPFRNSAKTIKNNLKELSVLIKADSNQLNQIGLLREAVDDRISFSLKYIEDKKLKRWNEEETSEILQKGKKLTDQIREMITGLNSDEASLLNQRKFGYKKSNQNSELVFLFFLGSTIVIFLLVILNIRNHKIRNDELQEFIVSQKLFSNYSLSLIEASLDPLVTISTDGKITDMNEALTSITGMTREELTGTDFLNYFTEPQKAREVYQEVFANGSVADSPLTLHHKNGKLTDVLFNGSVYKDDHGNVLGVVIVARDVAEQKWATELRIVNKALAYQNDEKEKRAAELIIANEELIYQNEEKEKRAAELIVANKELIYQNEEKEKRAAELILANKELVFQNEEKNKRAEELIIADKELIFQIREKEKQEIANLELEAISDSLKLASQYSLSLIEASRDPLFTVDPRGKITDMNQATVRVTGVSRKELIGTDFFNYFTEPERAKHAYQQVFEQDFIVDYPLTITDGNLMDVLCNGSVYKDDKGNVIGVVIVARDITDQKRIANELMEAIVFAEMAVAIAEEAKIKAESATLIAEAAVKAKQQFLSNMSHEIRTPMNAIIGFTKVLLKTETSTKQKEYLQAIKMSGDALIVLINDILDLAKVDAGKMIFEQTPFKMSASIAAMLHLFEPKIREKNLDLVREYDDRIPYVVLGDAVRLHQIILNLVSNAVKFTNKGNITVSVKLLSEDEQCATIGFAVKDTGIGISENKLEKIFDNFQQASSGTSRLYGGTGLGLAIVKQLVEAQDGTISVESKVGEGSTFGFILAFLKTRADAESEMAVIPLDTEIKNIKVLVVEDIALNQLLMKTLLDEFGFGCVIAANGKIAIEKLKAESFDIILMDLQMPEMNGFEATNYIRNTLHSSIPIIALTADVTTVDLVKCKTVGMNDYIAKPVDEKILYSKIVGSVKRLPLNEQDKGDESIGPQVFKYTDLKYLILRTKANPVLMMEMISLYLEQTPPLINVMKQSWKEKDWKSLYASVHKMIPSFAIMGISTNFEEMARKIQEYAKNQQQSEGISGMVLEIENVCLHACEELEVEFNTIKNTN
jgi:PAS domain S-box-containing protein